MCEKKIVDLSRYFLFEAAGDSESDHQENAYKANDDDDGDDDDAESCSYDVGYCGSSHSRNAQVDEVLEEKNEHDYDDGHDHHHHHDHAVVDDDDDDDEMREVDDTEVTSTANSYASRKCARSSKRKMSEVEKNRLFWEACLAS